MHYGQMRNLVHRNKNCVHHARYMFCGSYYERDSMLIANYEYAVYKAKDKSLVLNDQ